MSEFKWLYMFLIAVMLVFALSALVESRADQMDKQMCIDAGMRWEQTTEGVECVS